MKAKLFFYIFSIVIIAINADQSCTLKDGQVGTCKLVYECPTMLNDWKHLNKDVEFCNRDDKIVCCVEPPIPNISQRKCLEYITYAFEETEVPSVNPDLESEIIHKPICEIDLEAYSIIGGDDTKLREFPHMAGIGDNEIYNDKIFWFCGGTLLNERFVLTAAHCINSGKTKIRKTVTPRVVRLGSYDFDNLSEPHAKLYDIERSIAHPKYKIDLIHDDIGLIKLKENVEFSTYIRPACLPRREDTSPESKVVVTGWGSQQNAFDGILQKLGMSFIPDDKCTEIFNPTTNSRITQNIAEKIICYGGEKGKDACPGASGGPIHTLAKDIFCSYKVVGVTSAGGICAAGSPSLFTNVVTYLDFIEKTIWI